MCKLFKNMMMYFFLVISPVILCTSLYAQTFNNQKFILKGTVSGRDTGIITLRYINDLEELVRDTTFLKNGIFEFSGTINQPTYATLKGNPNYINFYDANDVGIYLEPGELKISLLENQYEYAKMEGSLTQYENDYLKKQIDSVSFITKDLNDALLEAKRKYISKKEPDFKVIIDSLNHLLKPTSETIKKVVLSFIINHPDSYVSPYMLAHPINYLSIDSAELLYSVLTQRIKNSRNGKWNAEQLSKKRQSLAGEFAPDFTAPNVKGELITLSDFKGKYVLLDFWASWCIPCREEIPELKKIYTSFHSKGFEIIMISIDKNDMDWEKAIKKDKITNWHNIKANEYINKHYENVNLPIPSKILVNHAGVIIWKSDNEENLQTVLNRYIK
ncbi:MAG: AhpC/TSA family protein [Nitrosopumilus sp.]|nr:AhpC/TSA family protein [Nitrosopumilus sp.]